jgi:YcxB-like protein
MVLRRPAHVWFGRYCGEGPSEPSLAQHHSSHPSQAAVAWYVQHMANKPDEVTVKFRLTRSDVFSALARHTIRHMWFLFLLPIIGAVSVVWAIVDPAEPAVNLNTGFGLFLFGLFLFLGLPLIQARSVTKTPNFGGPMTLAVSQQGIEFTGEHSNATIRWPMVKGVSEMSHAILIYLKPAGFQVVPKSQLSQADVAALRNILRVYAPGKVKLAKE